MTPPGLRERETWEREIWRVETPQKRSDENGDVKFSNFHSRRKKVPSSFGCDFRGFEFRIFVKTISSILIVETPTAVEASTAVGASTAVDAAVAAVVEEAVVAEAVVEEEEAAVEQLVIRQNLGDMYYK